MAENSRIEWTDHTFNPWIGCTKVSPGCDHCYAERLMDARMHKVRWGAGQPRVRTSDANWQLPLRWDDKAEREGRRYRVFCASLADVFDNEVPAEWRIDLFRLIEATPHLDWLLLTKRIGNASDMMYDARAGHRPLLPNLWLGATVVNQAEAERDIYKLLNTPAAVRFISAEPLLGPIDLTRLFGPDDKGEDFGGWDFCDGIARWINALAGEGWTAERHNQLLLGEELGYRMNRLNWVIVGGESGPGARPMHTDWARSIVRQCKAAGVPVFIKQLGAQPRGWCAAITVGDDPESDYEPGHCDLHEAHEQSQPCRGRCAMLCHPKGAAPIEWPSELRVREVPHG